MLPRHSAGSFELIEGTGPITDMQSCGEFLEIYKVDKTFRLRSPESIDPEETNPNAPFIASPVDDVGSGSPIVARVLLQSRDILKAAVFDSEVDKEAVILLLHQCKEALVACDKIATKIAQQVEKTVEVIKSQGIETDNHGRGFNPFPHIRDLDLDCGAFLIQANRAIKCVCEIPGMFFSLSRTDSNFDYLAKRLESEASKPEPLTQFVRDNSENVRYLIKLRNYHEHPRERKTIISNFTLAPDSKIQLPMWNLSGEPPWPIHEEMNSAITILTEIAEVILIHVVMASVSKKLPFIIEKIEDSKIDPSNPKRYRLSIDVNQLHFK